MRSDAYGLKRSAAAALETNKVLRNTYALLSMTLLFSAVIAGLAMTLNLPYPGLVPTLIGYYGLLFLTYKTRNSAWGLLCVFALTGFMGYTLGPIVNAYTHAYANGMQLVMLALGGTGATFLGLSAYALTSRRDFSWMGGMLFAGILVAILASLAAVFLNLPSLHLAVSAMVVLLMSGAILYHTSAILHGGETNYILATVGLYVAIYNLLLSLLNLLAAVSGERE